MLYKTIYAGILSSRHVALTLTLWNYKMDAETTAEQILRPDGEYCGRDWNWGVLQRTWFNDLPRKHMMYSILTNILDLTCCIWLYFCIGLKVHSKDILICYSRPTIWTYFFLLWAHTGKSTNLKSCLIYYFCGYMN